MCLSLRNLKHLAPLLIDPPNARISVKWGGEARPVVVFRWPRAEPSAHSDAAFAFPIQYARFSSPLERLAVVSTIERRTSPLDPGRSGGCYGGDPPGQEISRSLVFPLVRLGKRVGLAIDKVIHHDNVILAVIVRTWGGVPGHDPHAGDPGVVINHAEE